MFKQYLTKCRYYDILLLMKLIGSIILITLFLSCQTGPEPAAPIPQDPVRPPVVQAVTVTQTEEVVFEPENVSEELYVSTMEQVQALIGQLNGIIRGRNYNAWTEHIAEDYYREMNGASFLEERTEELFRRDQMVAAAQGRPTPPRRILRSSRDYFEQIVVPSRSNDRVDDIQFLTDNRVRAFTIDSRGNVLILYDLELIDGNWKIVN